MGAFRPGLLASAPAVPGEARAATGLVMREVSACSSVSSYVPDMARCASGASSDPWRVESSGPGPVAFVEGSVAFRVGAFDRRLPVQSLSPLHRHPLLNRHQPRLRPRRPGDDGTGLHGGGGGGGSIGSECLSPSSGGGAGGGFRGNLLAEPRDSQDAGDSQGAWDPHSPRESHGAWEPHSVRDAQGAREFSTGAEPAPSSQPSTGRPLPEFEQELLRRMQEQQEIVDEAVAASRAWMAKPSSIRATPWGTAGLPPPGGPPAPRPSTLPPATERSAGGAVYQRLTGGLAEAERRIDAIQVSAAGSRAAGTRGFGVTHEAPGISSWPDPLPRQQAEGPQRQQCAGEASWQLPDVDRGAAPSASRRHRPSRGAESDPRPERGGSPAPRLPPKSPPQLGSKAKRPSGASGRDPSIPRNGSAGSSCTTSTSGSGSGSASASWQGTGLVASKAASRAALEHVRAGFGRSQVSLKHIKRMTSVHTRTEEMVVLDDAARGLIALRQQLFKAHLKYLEVLRNIFSPAAAEATPAEATERLAKGSRRLLRVVTRQIRAGEALVAGWLESAAWLERNPSEQHGRAGLRRVLREAMLEVEATASHLNEASSALASVMGSLPATSHESPVKVKPAAAQCEACGACSAAGSGMPTPGKHARKNNFAAPSLAGSCDAPATPQRSAERSEQSPIAGDVTLVPSQLVLPSPFSQVQESLSAGTSSGVSGGSPSGGRPERAVISYPTASQLRAYDAPHLQQLVQRLMDEISHLRTEVSGRSADVGQLEGRLALQQEYIELLEEQAGKEGAAGAHSSWSAPRGAPAAADGPLRRISGGGDDGGSDDGSEGSEDILAAAAAATSWIQEQQQEQQRAPGGETSSSEGSSASPASPGNIPVRGMGIRAMALAARFGSTVSSSRVPMVNRPAAVL